jgi:hypothetical protein
LIAGSSFLLMRCGRKGKSEPESAHSCGVAEQAGRFAPLLMLKSEPDAWLALDAVKTLLPNPRFRSRRNLPQD